MRTADYPEVPDDFGHWLAGWIDGEGSFAIVHSSKAGFVCAVAVAVRDDDSPILGEIARRTGLGNVYYHRPRQVTRNARPQATWRVQKKAELQRLVELLDRYPLRSKKARDYAIWREAVLIWAAMLPRFRPAGTGQGRAANDWTRIIELRQQLIDGRAYRPRCDR